MPRKKKTSPPPRRRRIGWIIAAVLIICIALTLVGMHFASQVVAVRRAEVVIPDLPESFQGTTILYASDFDLCGLNTAKQAEHLFDRLQALNPDILLLGGDYASPSLLDRLNGNAETGDAALREAFFEAIGDFSAPLGKFCIAGDNDGAPEALDVIAQRYGVRMIDGTLAVVYRGEDAIGIVGVGAKTTNVFSMAAQVRSEQCVIVLTHSPNSVVDVRISEAANGGSWADLILAGHTHGGQINLMGRPIFALSETEKKYRSGWYTDGLAPLLVTNGVGCEAMNFRFLSQPEVWLITLVRGE